MRREAVSLGDALLKPLFSYDVWRISGGNVLLKKIFIISSKIKNPLEFLKSIPRSSTSIVLKHASTSIAILFNQIEE